MRNIKLLLEFDGTGYSGWLRQSKPGVVTVQSVVEQAVQKLTGEFSEVIGCSRTDAGVHAIGYIANIHTNSSIPPERFFLALNPLLPGSIKVRSSEEVPPDFHAVYSATQKTYRYYFYFDAVQRPLFCHRAWNAGRTLKLPVAAALKTANAACSYLIGEHDFSAFRAVGGLAKTTVRTIYKAEVKQESEAVFYLEISGNGFLYNMVRIISGTLVEVMQGKRMPQNLAEILQSGERKKAGMTAPPHGLYLYHVRYE